MFERNLVDPVYIGTVAGHRVRFFRGPSGKPDLPWHSLDDLAIAMGLPRDVRRQLLLRVRSFPGAKTRTVATADGITVTAPHWMAQGLIVAAEECHGVQGTFIREYTREGAKALDALTADLDQIAGFRFALTAFQNSNAADDDTGGDAA